MHKNQIPVAISSQDHTTLVGAVIKAITDAKGSLSVKTVSGGTLIASLENGKVILTDEKGTKATVVATDLKAGNGVVHVIDSVVLPK
jgi:uncharacterized surface protein with fasciclin (FAS1) repeats